MLVPGEKVSGNTSGEFAILTGFSLHILGTHVSEFFLPGTTIIFSDQVRPNVVKSGPSVPATDLTETQKDIGSIIQYMPVLVRVLSCAIQIFARTRRCLRLDYATSLQFS